MENINQQIFAISQLSNKERDAALAKYHIIQPYIQKTRKLLAISHEQNISLRTLNRWITNYCKKGLLGLARSARKDNGDRRCSTEIQQFIEGLYLQNRHLSKASIYRKSQESKLSAKCPSYRTICSIIAQIPKIMTALAHDGTKSY